MSDSYYLFSVTAGGLSKKEMTWLGEVLHAEANSPLLVRELGLDYEKDHDTWDPYPLFQCAFGPDGKSVDFWSDDHGSLFQVAHIVHRMMKKFNHSGYFKFTAAATCSKMLVDQFGGDTVWVSKHGCLWSSEIELLVDRAFEEGKEGQVQLSWKEKKRVRK